MIILAVLALILALALFKDGTADARRVGAIFIFISLVLFALRIDWSMVGHKSVAAVDGIVLVFSQILLFVGGILLEAVRIVLIVFTFIFLGPILLLVKGRK
ncbi:MAG: hypothetical protein AAB288_13430 [Acidobacteriota bacterium]